MIGPRPPYTDAFCAAATAAIIAAMKQTSCHRLVCQTGAMIGPASNRSCPMEWMARVFARWRRESARDREEQERIVESSSLDCTIVKPPRLTDSPPQGRVQASSLLRIGLRSKISRADLAAFIFDEVQTGRFVRQRIFVKGGWLTSASSGLLEGEFAGFRPVPQAQRDAAQDRVPGM